jgi:hypothetical protein
MSIRPVLAVVAACGVLFGASYAGARLTHDDDVKRAQPARPAPAPSEPAARELALGRSAELPALRKPPKREPRPGPATAGAGSAPAPVQAAPAPRPVPTEPETDDGGAGPESPQEGQNFDLRGPEPAPQTEPTPQPQPPPQQTSGPTDFYDEGG